MPLRTASATPPSVSCGPSPSGARIGSSPAATTAPNGAYVLYSLPATCKLDAVNPFDYLRDVLVRVGQHHASDVLAFNPKAWKHAREDLDASKDSSTAVG